MPDGSSTFVPFDDVAQRWWRVRGAAGTLRAETSPDGIAWSELLRIPATAAFASVQVSIGGGTYRAVPGGDQCRFESFNEPP